MKRERNDVGTEEEGEREKVFFVAGSLFKKPRHTKTHSLAGFPTAASRPAPRVSLLLGGGQENHQHSSSSLVLLVS